MKNGHTPVLALVVLLVSSGSAVSAVPPQLTVGADTRVKLTTESPRSAQDIFSEIGELTGITVHSGPKGQDSKISVEIDAASAAEAFDAVAEAAGYFWVPVDSSSIAIAENTPQNRRELEPLVIQVFPLEFAEIRDVDRLLRSVVEVRRLAIVEALRLIAVRDTVAKMIVIEHLIDLVDRSPGQVDLTIDVVTYRDSEKRPEAPTRIAVDSYRDLCSVGSLEVLAQGGLSVLGGRTGNLSVIVPTDDQADGRRAVEISAHPAQADGEAVATVETVIEFKPDGTLTASTEIAEGETWLIPWPHPNRTLDLAVAVSAINIEPPQFSPDDLEPYWVGTESRIVASRP